MNAAESSPENALRRKEGEEERGREERIVIFNGAQLSKNMC